MQVDMCIDARPGCPAEVLLADLTQNFRAGETVSRWLLPVQMRGCDPYLIGNLEGRQFYIHNV
jgi:hypothetical protein